jgi:hypothetical protein
MITACSSRSITALNENFFICDSVVSTPVTFELEWDPGPADSVSLELSGGPCTEVYIDKGWLKDKTIKIDFDAKKEAWLSVKMSFNFDTNEEHQIHYSVTVGEKILLDEDRIVETDSITGLSVLSVNVYLPLYHWKYFSSVKDRMDKICWNTTPARLDFKPDLYDTSGNRQYYDIRNKFTLSIESKKASVAFYDMNKKEIITGNVEGRINDLQKYGITLKEPFDDNIDDTISVFYENEDTFNEHRLIVSKNCETKVQRAYLRTKIDRATVHKGDTVNIIVTRIDEQGNETFFPDSTIFELGILRGCELGYLLNSDGEHSKHFLRIKQPLKMVITHQEKGKLSPVKLIIGLRDEENFIYPNSK